MGKFEINIKYLILITFFIVYDIIEVFPLKFNEKIVAQLPEHLVNGISDVSYFLKEKKKTLELPRKK